MPPETPPFRGRWTASLSNPPAPITERPGQSQKKNEKKTASPLILQPPKVKDVDLKQSLPRKQLFRAEPEEELVESSEFETEEPLANSEKKPGEFIPYEDISELNMSKEEALEAEESSEHIFSNEESSEDSFSQDESSDLQGTVKSEKFNSKSYKYPLLDSVSDLLDESESSDEGERSLDSLESLEKMHMRYGERPHEIKVKLPVNLAHVNLEVDIFDIFPISRPIESVTNVEWSIHSIDMDIVLPTANFFSKGILLLDLEYVENAGDQDSGTMHSLKIHVPWSKILKVEWLIQPELSCNHNKEYMFSDHDGSDPTFHREFSEKLVDKLNFQLTSLNCIWNEQLIENEKILVQGTANMQIDIYQKQCVDLRDLVCLH
ncbi:hypothetical protein [Mesobacillus subterraneus]|uniref:DUF3794 domain-containing protein n=1 Tax=Mesobacillus subterraneus TaxID=285983 RepID=A0A427TP42_9BACI|nr:hypothetical protein [Mesobacillus subterraneus]RSD26113.1 hypothetical protein EJA10_14900 [Mesobacillus subterraneus]